MTANAAAKITAIYVRVSSKSQDTRSQTPDLERWESANASEDSPIKWYTDKASGKTMDRPAWNRLASDLCAGRISRVIVWRLDRLGRTAKGLTSLFDDLQARGVGLISLREGLDLATPAGRLMANVIASVAQYETEVRGERVRAGQAAARAGGKKWGGSEKGRRVKVTDEQEKMILRGKADGMKVAAIAKAVGLSRPTVYGVLKAQPKTGNVSQAIKELRAAGLDAWDNVDDPESFIAELRG
jgi:DNA invertase Pin-like site-specific DNA recombinase